MSEPDLRRLTTILSALLGPPGPELTCEECFERLDVYAELELSGGNGDEAIPGMHEHLTGCPACAGDYESLKALLNAERGSA